VQRFKAEAQGARPRRKEFAVPLGLVHFRARAEGQMSFRSKHAKLGPLGSGGHSPELVWLTMQPVSFLFKRSQRVQLAIYGSDVTHFAPCADKTYDLKIWLGDQESSSHELSYGSRLLLPVVVD